MPRKPSDAGTLLTPEGHEDREEDSGWVVEEVAGPGRGARRAHLPVAACLVTQRTHGDIVSLVTHLHAGRERATASAGPGRTGAPLAHVARMPRWEPRWSGGQCWTRAGGWGGPLGPAIMDTGKAREPATSAMSHPSIQSLLQTGDTCCLSHKVPHQKGLHLVACLAVPTLEFLMTF